MTNQIERLFDPRQQNWDIHFELLGPLILGLTAVGRTTVDVLAMNERTRVQFRVRLISQGKF